MKFINYLIPAFLCLLFSVTAQALTKVTREDALLIAERSFQGQDVDYYLIDNKSSINWYVFVDAEPMKGWEHDCYILTIPYSISTPVDQAVPLRKELRKSPPARHYIPLSVKNRYNTNANVKPIVPKSTQSNSDLSAAHRTYAIILSGGIRTLSNHERYWNDCSFLYQTLANKYGVPKENIVPIMSDGDNPEEDMRTTTGTFQSQPLDLDYDGINDISLSATKSNIALTLNNLVTKMNKDDHLLFYVIDHGGSTDNDTNSYICLWDNEYLYDHELASMLEPFTSKLINVNVVLGQCNAGGFNDDLTKVGCVVSSACLGNESSWACRDIPYDEFVYQWTCAINEANHLNIKINSDSDQNGRITMQEAFEYAKQNDRISYEHPQYVSTPMSVGEDLAFNHLAPSVDIYIKDNTEDTGKEPNTTITDFWRSPSIWVRNKKDSICEHQNPEYSETHEMAYVYVRIHNRGKERFGGENMWVHVYWAQASTGLTPKAWKGREVYEDKYPTGGHLEAFPVPEINPGEYKDVCINWSLPQLLQNYPEGNFHFCLLAKLMDTPYDDGYVDGQTYFDILGNNDHAQKNVTIIRKANLHKNFNVYLRNIHPTFHSYTLELIPHTEYDKSLYSNAKVEIEMSPQIYEAWERGGCSGENIERSTFDKITSKNRKVMFISPQSKLKNIEMEGDKFDIVNLKFKFDKYSQNKTTYTFDLIQKDNRGEVVGGETFIVESPTLYSQQIEVEQTPIEDGKIQLKVDTIGYQSVIWKNSVGDIISNKNKVVVTPTNVCNSFEVVGVLKDGDVSINNITLEPLSGIDFVNITSKEIVVNLKDVSIPNSYILLTSTNNTDLRVPYHIPLGYRRVTIDSSGLEKGLYVINYCVGDTVIDSKKIVTD